ncbi:MAG: heme exporter protein CcmB [Acidobacteriota bacterium]
MKKVYWIIHKDIISEIRSKEIFSSMIIFSLLVVVTFSIAFQFDTEKSGDFASGILWIVFIFSGILGLNRSFLVEKDKGCLEGLLLCPIDNSVIYFGKMISNNIFVLFMELLILPIFSIFFNINLFSYILPLSLTIFLGTIGFIAIGTILSAMTINTRTREMLLPVILLPVAIPVIISSVKATGVLLEGGSLSNIDKWIKILLAFDIIFIVVSFLTFDYVVEE